MQALTGPATTTYSAGIDLHKQPVQIHVINAAGTPVYHGTITKNKRAALRAVLARFGTDITVGLESTYNWYRPANASAAARTNAAIRTCAGCCTRWPRPRCAVCQNLPNGTGLPLRAAADARRAASWPTK